ncbi:hypothetical protein [Bacillus sp. m3-13]|nr:hypothetical protein [Bacillus sp. m3-13]
MSEGSDGEEVTAALDTFHQKIGEVFEEVGLHAPNFEKDVY